MCIRNNGIENYVMEHFMKEYCEQDLVVIIGYS